MIPRYFIWRRFGSNPLLGIQYMTNKPGETTTWGSKDSAHKFTYKQACEIVSSFERERSRTSSEVWGKEVVY